MKKIRSRDGTQIAYWESGNGSPLLLVHGTTADHTRWVSVLPELEERFTVYAIDRRGRGESDDTAPYDISREFEDIAAVIDSLGGSVNVLGHSYGAVCSLEAALLTRNIAKLVLYEPPLPVGIDPYPPGTVERIQNLVEDGDRDGAVSAFFREVVRMPDKELEMLRTLPSWAARVAAAHTIPREMKLQESYRFLPDRFRNLRVKTLLLLGGDSPAFLQKPTEMLHQILSDSRVVVMPGQQHTAMNTAPDLFVAEVLKFLLA